MMARCGWVDGVDDERVHFALIGFRDPILGVEPRVAGGWHQAADLAAQIFGGELIDNPGAGLALARREAH